MWVLFAYFAVATVSIIWLNNDRRDIDQPLRAALAIPIMWTLCRLTYDLRYMWTGIIVGIALSVAVGWWQLHIVGLERAEGYLNIIHFGNIALVFGAFCAGGLQWATRLSQHRNTWCVFFLFGMGSSVYSVIASGSRASWVALPVLVLLYGVAFVNRRNVAWVVGSCALMVATAVVMFNQPESKLRARYDAAISDIRLFQHGEADTSLGARFVMWEGAIRSIPQRPLFGWNFDKYHEHIEQLVNDGKLNPVALKFTNNLHNGYLHSWVFHGLPGLLAILALYLVPFGSFCRRLRESNTEIRVLAYCGAAVSASYALFSLSQVILQRNNGIMFYVLSLVILWGGIRQRERNGISTVSSTQ